MLSRPYLEGCIQWRNLSLIEIFPISKSNHFLLLFTDVQIMGTHIQLRWMIQARFHVSMFV